MLIDSLNEFSNKQTVTTTAVASKVIDQVKAGDAKLTELHLHVLGHGGFASTNTLTVGTQPTAGDTFTIGGKVYTCMADGTADADGEVDVGADLADFKTLIIAAINGTDDNNEANAYVTAGTFTGDALALTANDGVNGDDIACTETFTAAGNVFAYATMGGATVTITLQTSATAADNALTGTIIDLVSSKAFTIAELNSKVQALKMRQPEGALGYIGIKYTVASGALTAGSFSAFLNADG